MKKCYKFRLYPTCDQSELMQKTFGCCRFVFNKYLAKRKEAYSNDKATLSYNACSADMTKLKNDLGWLKDVDATALQSSLRDLDVAYQNFLGVLNRAVRRAFLDSRASEITENHTNVKPLV